MIRLFKKFMGIRQLALAIVASSSLLFLVNSIYPEKIQAQQEVYS